MLYTWVKLPSLPTSVRSHGHSLDLSHFELLIKPKLKNEKGFDSEAQIDGFICFTTCN